jgi:hypothetical protein
MVTREMNDIQGTPGKTVDGTLGRIQADTASKSGANGVPESITNNPKLCVT